MRPALVPLYLLLVLAACKNTHAVVRSGDAPRLVRSGCIYVAVPEDGRHGEIVYSGSGGTTAMAIETALQQHGVSVTRGAVPAGREVAMAEGRTHGCTYCIVPTIRNWEDRATEWSMRSDRIEIELELIDLGVGQTLDTVTITGKSKLMTFGGDHPQELIDRPVAEYVDSLF